MPMPNPFLTGSRAALRNIPRFAHAIAPGCSLNDLVPDLVPPSDLTGFAPQNVGDLFYPVAPLELHLEVGTADSVPAQCWGDGLRARQASAFEALQAVDPVRYLVHLHEGAGHDLLNDQEATLHERLSRLVKEHFFPPIFQDGYEERASSARASNTRDVP
jgi:hypothetical protein